MSEKDDVSRRDRTDAEPILHSVEAVRDQLANGALVAGAILGFPLLGVSLYRSYELGLKGIHFLHIGVYCIALVTAILHRRLPFRVRVAIIWGMLLFAGTVGLLKMGLSGMGLLWFMTNGILTTVLLGLRAGMVLTVLGMVLTGATGVAICLGWVSAGYDANAYAVAPSSWVFSTLSTGFFASIVIAASGRLQAALIGLIHELNDRTTELGKTNVRLAEEASRRKQANEELSAELKKFEALYDLAVAMSADRSLDDNLRLVALKARELLAADRSCIALSKQVHEEFALVSPDTESGSFRAICSPDGSDLVVAGPERCEAGSFLDRGEGTGTPPELKTSEDSLSVVSASVRMGVTDLGSLSAVRSDNTPFSRKDRDTLTLLGNLAAVEIVRARGEAALRTARERLEVGVAQRTAELARINRTLESEITERKRAEATLRESEETLLALLNANTDAAFLVDTSAAILASNEVFAQRFGLTAKELLGRYLFDLFSSEIAAPRRTRFDELMASGKAVRFADVRADRLYDNNAVPILDADGKVERLAVFSRDITEQERAQDALRESRERYRLLVDHAPVGIAVHVDGVVVFVNETGASIMGGTPRDCTGKSVLDFVPLKLRETAWRAIQEIIEGWKTVPLLEQRWLRLDGSIVYVQVAAAPIQYEGKRGLQVFFTDRTELKLAEEALRQSEERYRTLMEATPDPIVVYDTDGNVVYLNPEFTRVFGWTLEERGGTKLDDFIPRDELPETTGAFERMLRGEAIVSLETRRLTRDGRLLEIQGSSSVFRDRGGKPAGSIVILRDVTERKRIEAALRASEERNRRLYEESKTREELYRSLLNSSPDAVVIYDKDGRVRYFNPSFTHTFGWELEELAGKLIPFVPDSERAPTDVMVQELLNTADPRSGFETRRFTRQGDMRDVSISASVYRDHEESVVGLLAILRDITEKKNAERALLESRERLHLALEAAHADMWEVNLQSGETVPAQRFFHRLGYDTEAIPRNIDDMWRIVHPDDLQSVLSSYRELVRGISPEMHAEYRFRAHEEGWVWCATSGKVIEWGPGDEPSRFIGLTTDISEQMEAKRTIAEAAEREAIQRGKIQMAATILHDIGNAITGLGVTLARLLGDVEWRETRELGRLTLMAETQKEAFTVALGPGKAEALIEFTTALRTTFEERRRRFHQQFQTMANTLAHIQEILELQRRYVRDGSWGENRLLGLAELVEDALSMLRVSFERRHIRVRTTFGRLLPSVTGDRTKLIQVFLNVFKNACEAFDGGGDQEDRALDVDIGSVLPGRVRVTVSDNAMGFDPDLASRVFDEGFSTKKRDSGLGLFQCRGIIETHGGSIWLESRGKGQGARVTIELPAAGEGSL